VVLNTSDYKQKVSSLLEDPAYRKLVKDPTDAIERKTTLLLKKSSLTEETRRQLCPAGSRPPRMYGLPKIHKEGIPATAKFFKGEAIPKLGKTGNR